MLESRCWGLHGGPRQSLLAPRLQLHCALSPRCSPSCGSQRCVSLTCDKIGCTRSPCHCRVWTLQECCHSSESLVPVSVSCSCGWRDWHDSLPQSTISKTHLPNKLTPFTGAQISQPLHEFRVQNLIWILSTQKSQILLPKWSWGFLSTYDSKNELSAHKKVAAQL